MKRRGEYHVAATLSSIALPENANVSEIIIHDDENVDRALRRFKKKVERAGILRDLRKHREYEKPSERRKRKLTASRRNRRSRHA